MNYRGQQTCTGGRPLDFPAHATLRVLSRGGEPSTYLMGFSRPVEPGWTP